MNPTPIQFLWSDAWLLTSIYGASRGDSDATLTRVIGVGDFINHAIFTLAELNGGISRLHRAGLIELQIDSFQLTTRGKDITEDDPDRPEAPMKHMDTIRKRLNADPWKPGIDPNDAGDPNDPTLYVTEDRFRSAYDEYCLGLKRRKKKKK